MVLLQVVQGVITLLVVFYGVEHGDGNPDSGVAPATFYDYSQGVQAAAVLTPAALNNYTPPGKVCFLVHGWTQSWDSAFIPYMATVMLARGYTVIGVDWTALAGDITYISSAFYTKLVGQYLATIICSMNVDPANVTIIGNSMGAHVAGQAGRYYQATCGKGPLGRIDALDAAGPGFNWNPAGLAYTDAKTVLAIHSDLLFGIQVPVAKYDFFAGTVAGIQPGCPVSIFSDIPAKTYTALQDIILDYVYRLLFCSHVRSYIYFLEVAQKLGPDAFVGTDRSNSTNKCQITVEEPQCSSGSYDFETKSSAPYAEDTPIVT